MRAHDQAETGRPTLPRACHRTSDNRPLEISMPMLKYLFVILFAVLLSGCSRDKEPAEAAIKAAAQAIDQIRGEASRYAPDQLKQLEGSLKAAQDSFAKKEYTAALAAAAPLAGKAQEVAKAAADKKAELTKAWDDLNAGIPELAASIKGRIDGLAHAKTLPSGLDKDKLAALSAGLDDAMKQLQAAKDAAASDLAKAIEAGKGVKERLAEVAAALGVTQ